MPMFNHPPPQASIFDGINSQPMMGKQTIPLMPSGSLTDHRAVIQADIFTDIPSLLEQWASKRVVLVASRALSNNTDIINRLTAQLGQAIVGIKVGVGSHSPYSDVLEIAHMIQTSDADCVISIGSGSYSDAAKIARLLASKFRDTPEVLIPEGVEALVDQNTGWTRPRTFGTPSTRFIIVPCSLSVGEYNPVGSATNLQGKKQHFNDFENVAGAPDVVLLDPSVIAHSVPESLWLQSGARAVDHAVETMIYTQTASDGVELAKEALKALVSGLHEYKECWKLEASSDNPRLLDAVTACQIGARNAIAGLICYGSRLGPSHAAGHQLGSACGVPHGFTTCVLLPAVLRYEDAHPDSNYWDTAKHSDIVRIINGRLGPIGKDAGTVIEKFFRGLGLPTRLPEVGVTNEAKLRQVAEQTLTDVWGGGQKQMNTAAEVLDMLQLAK